MYMVLCCPFEIISEPQSCVPGANHIGLSSLAKDATAANNKLSLSLATARKVLRNFASRVNRPALRCTCNAMLTPFDIHASDLLLVISLTFVSLCFFSENISKIPNVID